ncbi:MAG: M20/M25/M40 family metallo-hydrolase [Fimbriimonadaceae bacterium]|nr:M20/M25/M40 family metallo-hydrolase [Fimbriimonadaceae bacterium]QYK56308.1 MAG: M20/M25/M40 family metallo-hydrolase [Fimbriimonadaceae bacterium]
MRAESLDFFRQITNAPSPSGFEERAAQVFRDYTGAFAHEVATDVHGNVHAVLNPKAEARVMLSGHMDEIGFIVHYISDEGFLYVNSIGGHDPMVAVAQRVWVQSHGRESVVGVFGRKPVHLQEEGDKKRPEIHELYIDIGAANKEEAERAVELGSFVTYQWEFAEMLGDRVCARGMDNKMGAFIVAEALRILAEDGGLDEKVGVYAVGTVQEEIGLRGARTAAFGIGAQSGLAVDVDFAIDQPGLSKSRYGQADLGKGPTVTRGANVNPVVFSLLREAAQKDGISIQIGPYGNATGTDANAMQVTRAGMATGVVGVPIRYMHTPSELLSLQDVEDCARLMAGYCRLVRPDTDFTPRLP